MLENGGTTPLYFDELVITRWTLARAEIHQDNHYYPFGMNMVGIEELDKQSIDALNEWAFQYNAQEKVLDLAINDHALRNLDL